MRFLYRLSALVLVVTVGVIWAASAEAYPAYRGTPACINCHPGFPGFGPTHGLHLSFIADCTLCHNVVGDNPSTAKCADCHLEYGLRLHHTNAGAPPDPNGLTCVMCHPNDPAPPPENTVPPNYFLASVSVKDPCSSLRPPGEDASGDGRGLDNDGDLLYDEQDPDCALATENTTWGRIKALFVE